jgi:hypothetical protein
MLTSFFTVKPAVASAPKKAVKKIVQSSPCPPSPSPSPVVDMYIDTIDDDDDAASVDSLDGGGEVVATPISECADKDSLSDVEDDTDLNDDGSADIDDIFTLLRTQSRRSLDMSGPELCCDDEDF